MSDTAIVLRVRKCLTHTEIEPGHVGPGLGLATSVSPGDEEDPPLAVSVLRGRR